MKFATAAITEKTPIGRRQWSWTLQHDAVIQTAARIAQDIAFNIRDGDSSIM
jgi:hypothetical protein